MYEQTKFIIHRTMKNHLSSPEPEHTPGGTVRGGARRYSRVGRGRAVQDADVIVRQGENSVPGR